MIFNFGRSCRADFNTDTAGLAFGGVCCNAIAVIGSGFMGAGAHTDEASGTVELCCGCGTGAV